MEPTPRAQSAQFSPAHARPLLIHSHIFKNAGTSVDRLLAECFGTGWTTYETALPARLLEAEGLRDFLATRPSIRAVSSHLPLALLSMPNSVPIVMLRHPIDRARSVFQFLKRDTSQEDHPAASGRFADYVTWALDTFGKGAAIRNYQVFHLSTAPLRRDNIQLATTNDDLARATAVVGSLPAFGLVRHFATSCRVFQVAYAAVLPELRLREVRENASADAAGTEADAIDATREELGEAVFARLLDANTLDMALYNFARTLFETRARCDAFETGNSRDIVGTV